ncbi:C2 calcium-dependent domain-containing protein 4C-like [Pimephales promelas]|uniref:C2 calcium-dependent domain-containing protein 4C-like n=1 Tax=Pimephales promelas TaxID=90988 RepID=UPI001955AC07|nr:C2 calcium-dependent domain-containing protein 4C-like [Pimephales promelas]
MGRNRPARDFAPPKREKSWQSSSREIQPAAARQVPLRNMVVTPASVPEFTIPSLCTGRLQGCGREKVGVGHGRRHTFPRSAHPSSFVRALARCCPFSEERDLVFVDDLQTYVLSDPTTSAAMSLPHLCKITTPYGFLTLAESPSVRNVRTAGDAAQLLHDSCDCSELRPAHHLSYGFLRKGWIKCLPKFPWSQ